MNSKHKAASTPSYFAKLRIDFQNHSKVLQQSNLERMKQFGKQYPAYFGGESDHFNEDFSKLEVLRYSKNSIKGYHYTACAFFF